MKPSILLTFAHGERGSERCIALGRAAAADDLYGPMAFGDIPVDVRFEAVFPNIDDADLYDVMHLPEIRRQVNVELKLIPDFWASKATGHLGTQILTMVEAGQPGFVAVYGSLQDTMEQIPKIKTVHGRIQKRTHFDIASDANTARAMCSDSIAANVPIYFLSPDHGTTAKWILSMAKHILLGPSMAPWLPRFPVDARAYGMLCAIHGVGDVAAKKLLATYGGMGQIANECKHNPEGLAACVGGSKAKRLLEVLG